MEDHALRKIIKESAREAVHETLIGLGVRVDEPYAIQEDLIYLRKLRVGSEQTRLMLKRSAIGTFVVGITTVLIMGIKEYLGR